VGNVKALSDRPDLWLPTMEEVEILPCIFSSFTMICRSKTNVCHASDVEPPATRHFAVNKHRDEAQTSVVDVDIDDVKYPKPSGQFFADTSTLKTRNESLNICTWNVRTLYQAGKLDNLIMEFNNLKLDILGVSETHWSGSGIIQRENHTIIYSGGEENRKGVGLMFHKKIAKCLLGYWPISERNIMCKIQA